MLTDVYDGFWIDTSHVMDTYLVSNVDNCLFTLEGSSFSNIQCVSLKL